MTIASAFFHRSSGKCNENLGACAHAHVRSHFRAGSPLARNRVRWNCSAFGSDGSDSVVLEDNAFECTNTGAIGGTYIADYDLYHHPSSKSMASCGRRWRGGGRECLCRRAL